MRAILVAVCVLALAGCNAVYSKRPLFSEADTAGAPQLRYGVWLQPSPDCAVDEALPLKDWPQCAQAMIARRDGLHFPGVDAQFGAYLLVAGDPPILQMPLADDKSPPLYFYRGLKITRRDEQGRAVEFVSWRAQCGPPPPTAKFSERQRRYLTYHLLPGLRADRKKDACVAGDPAAVRGSAKASEAWNDDPTPTHWVRDGEQ